MFEPLPARFDFPAAEKRILAFWDENDIFGQSLKLREGAERFVFYEGPPTANGLPHPGHCLTRVMKDIFPRYKTMRGFLVERKGGWDTHGLPVEREVCKELGIRTKQEIEAYGVEKFNLKCIQSVFRYTREWEEMTRRLAYWVDLKNAYVTYHQSYVESVWWSLKTLFDRDVLYQGHKIVWWWAQGGTALSSGEVGEGYKTVDDPSVFVKFPLVEAGEPGVLKAKDDPELNEQLVALLAELSPGSKGDVTIDFTNVKFVTSASLGRLLDLRKVVAGGGCELRLRGVGDALRRLFAAVALNRVFEIEPTDGASAAGDGPPPKTSLLVWTTTPWTLVSNHFAAVHPDLEYALVHDAVDDEHLYVAAALVEAIGKKAKRELRVVSTCKGSDLIGLRYVPPFRDVYYDREFGAGGLTYGTIRAELKDGRVDHVGWRVLAADFVTIESGTGLVHEAPAFGEVDFNLLQQERQRFTAPGNVPVLCAVKPDGAFDDDSPAKYRGRWVKDCDKEITRELRDERKTPWGTPLLYHQEQYRHDYPFCPQSPDDPLIQYARKSWFVRTSQFKDEFLKNNAAINWLPEHIKEGRFGDFLRNNVDWALSRERYWGTPLPIWRCESCGKMEAIGSFAELRAKPGATDGGYWDRKVAEHKGEEFPAHLRVHKPYIDEWTYGCPACVEAVSNRSSTTGSKPVPQMRRVPEVIDCWWDAGSMPFAQWGFPHADGSVEIFAQRFPADFISEAIDQTRGWFYGLLAISTLLFSTPEQRRVEMVKGGPTSDATVEDLKRQIGNFDVPMYEAPNTLHSMFFGNLVSAEKMRRMEPAVAREIRFGPHPFRTCIVLGHIAGEDGNKMSKKLRNYKEPSYIFDSLGADAMRWYFLSAQAPWTSTRFAEAAIRDSQREFLVKLYNVLSFFTIYASIDGFDPSKVGNIHFAAGDDPRAIGGSAGPKTNPMGWRPSAQRTELDRWIITELRSTVAFVRESMDRFENYPAAQKLNDFVDALSNWYVRRSRDRFWRPKQNNPQITPTNADESNSNLRQSAKSAHPHAFAKSADESRDQEKWDAYHTLYGCLRVLSHLIAPFTPFFAENMHGILRIPEDPISIHLCDYPTPEDIRFHDDALAATMDTVRELVALGRSARTVAKLKVRQPLGLVELILARPEQTDAIRDHAALVAEELNVKRVELVADADKYVTYKVVPNFKAIGAKFRELVPKLKDALGKLPDAAAARRTLLDTGSLPLTIDGQTVNLTPEEVEIRLDAKPGWSAAQGKAGVVVLSTEITAELRDEGVIRELIHFVQTARKERNLPYEARIVLKLDGPPEFVAIVRKFEDVIKSECLVSRIEFGHSGDGAWQMLDIEGFAVKMAIAGA
jgi:isoleucyl-tRNA synthetase